MTTCPFTRHQADCSLTMCRRPDPENNTQRVRRFFAVIGKRRARQTYSPTNYFGSKIDKRLNLRFLQQEHFSVT